MAQGLDLMTMARVSRGDEKAEVHVAGTIRHTYCAVKNLPDGCLSIQTFNASDQPNFH
jgi:hypothetical protein